MIYIYIHTYMYIYIYIPMCIPHQAGTEVVFQLVGTRTNPFEVLLDKNIKEINTYIYIYIEREREINIYIYIYIYEYYGQFS